MSEEERVRLEKLAEEYRSAVRFHQSMIKTFLIALPIGLVIAMTLF